MWHVSKYISAAFFVSILNRINHLYNTRNELSLICLINNTVSCVRKRAINMFSLNDFSLNCKKCGKQLFANGDTFSNGTFLKAISSGWKTKKENLTNFSLMASNDCWNSLCMALKSIFSFERYEWKERWKVD